MATGPTPFEPHPSASYAFEPEFTGHPPRPIPDRLNDGPHARRRRLAAIVLALAGIVCLALSRAPGLDVLARYVLPLAYLPWIGLGLLTLGAGAYVALALHTGPFRYVRHGIPIAVRVMDVVKSPAALVNGSPSTHAFFATVAFKHPATGEAVLTTVRSDDFSSARKDAYDVPFKVGDDVTGVYLPNRLEKTLRLYPFLDLSPDVNLTAQSAARSENPILKAAVLLIAVPAIFVILFANIYAYGRYHPLQTDYRQFAVPLAAGGLLLGGGIFTALYLSHRAEQKRLLERAALALAAGKAVETGTPFLGHGLYAWVLRVVVFAGSLLMGGLTVVCWCFMANAWLDRSPARPVPATVVGMTMTTHAFLFRKYELEYRVEGSSEKRKLLTTPEHLMTFHGPEAVAQVREGRLGWPWVETVTP